MKVSFSVNYVYDTKNALWTHMFFPHLGLICSSSGPTVIFLLFLALIRVSVAP